MIILALKRVLNISLILLSQPCHFVMSHETKVKGCSSYIFSLSQPNNSSFTAWNVLLFIMRNG